MEYIQRPKSQFIFDQRTKISVQQRPGQIKEGRKMVVEQGKSHLVFLIDYDLMGNHKEAVGGDKSGKECHSSIPLPVKSHSDQ